MSSTKINYGIDLGTTNSAIARMEGGEPLIKKSDTLKDTMPSCVSFNKKRSVLVGDAAMNAYKSDKLRMIRGQSSSSNTYIEFKRTMGTDKKYHSSNMDADFSSEELSSEVLKKLKSFITDEDVKSIVVTVPAKFTINQKDATTRAATLAGFKHCELLQEPIAASMAYGLDSNSKDGHWMVFDFGGGTFDAALLKVEEGIMKVIDTEGDNWLGGKNLDNAIVDELLLPYINENFAISSTLNDESNRESLRQGVKYYAEEAKVQLSFNETYNILTDLGELGEDDEGEELELDLTITQQDLKNVIGPIFQKAIDICKALLNRNNVSESSLNSLILVGGPTYSPILRTMLKEQIMLPDTSTDPMTAVAKGAALYASTINVSEEVREQTRDRTKIQIELGYEATTVEEEEFVTVKILADKTEGEIPVTVLAEIKRGDGAWSSGKSEINERGEVFEVKLNSGKTNSFHINLYNDKGDILDSEPREFTIIQGSKIGSATLPYHIGLEIKSKASGKVIFRPVKGLEKNQSTPAVGIENGLKTQKQIRPGIKDDFIKIPIYQGDYGSEGSRAIYNEHVYDVVISGEDVPSLLPEGSDVDITLSVDKSERMKLSAFFPYLDHTHEVEVPTDTTQTEIDAIWLESEIRKAEQTLNLIIQEGTYNDSAVLNKLESDIADLNKRFEQGRTDYDRKKEVLENLRRVLRKLDDIQDASEWPKTEDELKAVFYRLEETNKNLGNEKTSIIIEQLKEQIPEVIKEKDVKVARELIDNMRHLDFVLIDEGLGAQMEIGLLQQFNEDFDSHDWSDRNKARILINEGLQIAANEPSKERLRPIVLELYKLLPDTEQSMFSGSKDVLSD